LNARRSASLASRARTSAGLFPRATSKVNTGVSDKRTTPDAELGAVEALGAGVAEALGSDAAAALGGGVAFVASGTTAAVAVAVAGGGSLGALGALGALAAETGAGSGSGATAEAEAGACTAVGAGAETAAAAETGKAGAAEGNGLAETTGKVAAVAPPAGVCARSRFGLNNPRTRPTHRKQSPQTRADVDELTEVLTLGLESFGHRLHNCKHNCRAAQQNASARKRGSPRAECPHRHLEPVAKFWPRE